ncbi:MAG: hypothetical protein JST26_09745 [Bacteroidetes bacterium]|nr:hypothetical protein [Bacteroidota bacterium]
MSPQYIHPGQKRISSWLGTYYRGVETKNFIYFVNYKEGDENSSVKMYDKISLELICDNYHCYNDMLNVLLEKQYTYLSPTMKLNLKEWLKQIDDSFF